MEIHRSVYYYHCKNKTNSYKVANQQLDIQIKQIFDESKGRYGSPKITKKLQKDGIQVSQKRVARRMKVLGLKSIVVKKYNHVGSSKTDDTKDYPNLLEQDFLQIDPVKNGLGI